MTTPILAPDGITHARQAEVLMTSAQVRWLLDGHHFLQHVQDLSTLRIVALCKTCQRPVSVVDKRDFGHYDVHCSCRHGKVDASDSALDVAPLLMALNWNLACPDCQTIVTGNNPEGATVLTVTCPCTKRVWRQQVH